MKEYDALECGRCLDILVANGVGPRTTRLLWTYWERLTIVAQSGRYHIDPFTGTREMTQGYPLSPAILNMVVGVAIHHWATLVAGEAAGP